MIGFKLNLDKIDDKKFKNFLELVSNDRMQIEPTITVNGLPIHYSTGYRRIGVVINGDYVSTMLLLLLCLIIRKVSGRTRIYPIYINRKWPENSWSDEAVINIYERFKLRFPEIIMEITKGFLPKEMEGMILSDNSMLDAFYFRSYQNYLIELLKLNAIYSSTSLSFDDNTDTEISLIEKSKIGSKEINYIAPFKLINRSWVLAQYENLREFDLLKMTRSCFMNGKQCRKCINCLDRKIIEEKKDCFLEYNHVSYTSPPRRTTK